MKGHKSQRYLNQFKPIIEEKSFVGSDKFDDSKSENNSGKTDHNLLTTDKVKRVMKKNSSRALLANYALDNKLSAIKKRE